MHIFFLPFIIGIIFYTIMLNKTVKSIRTLATRHPQGWLVSSDEDKIIFRDPRGEQNGAVLLAVGRLVFPFLIYGFFYLDLTLSHLGPSLNTDWQLLAICICLEVPSVLLAWLGLRISGKKDLELDLKQRTYKYIHQPPWKLPATRKQGSLNEFSRVTLHRSNSRDFPYTHFVLMPQTSNHIKDGYNLGSFSNDTEAMNFGEFIAERFEIKLAESGKKRVNTPIVTIKIVQR